MRLAYLFSRFPVVSQTFCDTEMLALEAAGFSLVIGSLNPPPNSFRHERLAQLQAEVIYPPPPAVLHPPAGDPDWQAMAALAAEHEVKYGPSCKPHLRARNAFFFAREFKKRGVTHVHVHFANRATHTALFLKKAGFTFSFTAHAQDFMVDLGNDDLLREMIREATFTAAVSDYSRALLTKICPDAAARIHRVYNGIDASQFPAALPGGPPEAPFRLVSIGRLIDFKGFPVLLHAIAALRGQGLAVDLQIIGEGPQRHALETLIGQLGLGSHVRLRGVLRQEEIKQELATAHAFALACLTDAKGATDILPTVILEAMACGLPVVSTTLAGVPEMVVHGETGLLAPPADAPAFAAHLAVLAQDPALRARLGEAGRRRVEDVFALDQTAGHLASLFPQPPSALPPDHRPGPHPASSPSGPAVQILTLLDAPAAPGPALPGELAFLTAHPAVTVLATRLTHPAPGMEFLPDATVLEAAWRSHPALAARAEALRPEAGPVDSELFYLTARRAVHLATQIPVRGWTGIHALRASTVLLAWLLHRLTGLPASATIEATHQESRTVLTKLLPAFTRGSNSDPKLKSAFPDLFHLQGPAPAKRLFGFIKLQPAALPPADPAPLWQHWLTPDP